ncbi:hypothetical protein N218_10570 [Campylobacter jejuni K5]|nr:hypothetical protein N218_10570 [Campylobacter jejuni K5]
MDINGLNSFLVELGNMSNFKRIKYNGELYKGEISFIQEKIKQKDTDAIIEVWRKKIESKKFELEHPIYPNIKTRAVYNIFNGRAANYVFMIDKDNKYPWIFTQATCLIDYAIVPGYVINIASPWPCHGVHIFKDINPEKLLYSEKLMGFTMEMTTPQHYTYFLYQFFIQLDKKNIINKNFPIKPHQCFFLSEKYISNTNYLLHKKNIVYLYPMGIEALYRREAEHLIYQESLKTTKIIEKTNEFDLIIWLGLSAYRTWIEQEDGVKNIVAELSKYFKKIKIYFNGITSYDSKIILEKQDFGIFSSSADLFERIKNKIKEIQAHEFYCELISLDSKDYRTKISYCDSVDVCISEGNTTGMVPFQFCKKPGVNFIAPQSNGEKFGTIIEGSYIVKSLIEDNSYHMSWEHVFNRLVDIIFDVKKIKMEYIKEPDVKLLQKQHEIYQDVNIKIPIEFIFLYEAIYVKFDKMIQNKLFLEAKNKLSDKKENITSKNKELEVKNKELEVKNKELEVKNNFISKYNTAKSRIQNQLSYRLGQAMIVNSKSFLDYVRMPIVLISISILYKQEQKIYQEKFKKNPSLKLPPLENYPDYKEAIKEKECLTYKLGEALIKANKTWYKGGYVKLWFEIRKLKKINKGKNYDNPY